MHNQYRCMCKNLLLSKEKLLLIEKLEQEIIILPAISVAQIKGQTIRNEFSILIEEKNAIAKLLELKGDGKYFSSIVTRIK